MAHDSTTPGPPFLRYTRLVTETDLLLALREQGAALGAFLRAIPAAEAGRLHAPYTWTLRQVAGHIIDFERVLGYRALRFARGDTTPLPGFDENLYAAAANADDRTLDDLAAEFAALRESHVHMFAAFPHTAWLRRGTASSFEWTVTDLAKTILGHARHHETIVQSRLTSVTV